MAKMVTKPLSQLKRKRPKQPKKISGFEKRLLDIIKEVEDKKIHYYRRKRISTRRLKFAGKFGMKESEAQKAISSKLLLGSEYAQSLFQSLYDKDFLIKSKLDYYRLSQDAIEAMGLVLRKRGYVAEAVRMLLRRELASRGMVREMREHRPPRRTRVIPPIIGHF